MAVITNLPNAHTINTSLSQYMEERQKSLAISGQME